MWCSVSCSNASDEQNEAVLEALNASGTSYMVSSKLGGQTVLRCAIGGGLTTRKHIDEVGRLMQLGAL